MFTFKLLITRTIQCLGIFFQIIHIHWTCTLGYADIQLCKEIQIFPKQEVKIRKSVNSPMLINLGINYEQLSLISLWKIKQLSLSKTFLVLIEKHAQDVTPNQYTVIIISVRFSSKCMDLLNEFYLFDYGILTFRLQIQMIKSKFIFFKRFIVRY